MEKWGGGGNVSKSYKDMKNLCTWTISITGKRKSTIFDSTIDSYRGQGIIYHIAKMLH